MRLSVDWWTFQGLPRPHPKSGFLQQLPPRDSEQDKAVEDELISSIVSAKSLYLKKKKRNIIEKDWAAHIHPSLFALERTSVAEMPELGFSFFNNHEEPSSMKEYQTFYPHERFRFFHFPLPQSLYWNLMSRDAAYKSIWGIKELSKWYNSVLAVTDQRMFLNNTKVIHFIEYDTWVGRKRSGSCLPPAVHSGLVLPTFVSTAVYVK